MILSVTLWFAFIATVINGHNHEIVMIVDNSLSLTSSECIQQQRAISDLFKDYKNVNISNDVSYISFSHYESDFTQLISFKDIQNDIKSIENLASKIKTFDCNQHILSNKKIKIKNKQNQLLNVLKYAISSYQNSSKTKRILLFNNFETSTKSQEEICEYFIQNNKENLHMDIKYEANTFDNILALVSVNIMGHGVNKYYLKCNETYIKKNITLNNSSLTTFNGKHHDIIYAICPHTTNGTCEDCIKNCAGGSMDCPRGVLDTCEILMRCAFDGLNGGPRCCGRGLVDECCEMNSDGSTTDCIMTPVTDFGCGKNHGKGHPPGKKGPKVHHAHAMRNTANMLDGLNSNDEMSGVKSPQIVTIKFDSLWMIIGMVVTFCIVLICCACIRKTKQTQFEPDTISSI